MSATARQVAGASARAVADPPRALSAVPRTTATTYGRRLDFCLLFICTLQFAQIRSGHIDIIRIGPACNLASACCGKTVVPSTCASRLDSPPAERLQSRRRGTRVSRPPDDVCRRLRALTLAFSEIGWGWGNPAWLAQVHPDGAWRVPFGLAVAGARDDGAGRLDALAAHGAFPLAANVALGQVGAAFHDRPPKSTTSP